MSQTIRVSLPGYNALTDTNPDHYALYADSDNVLIKEFTRGSGTVALNATATIAHNLGYVCMYLFYTQVSSSRYRLSNSATIYQGWSSWANDTNIYVKNSFSATYTGYRYYIFYDQQV